MKGNRLPADGHQGNEIEPKDSEGNQSCYRHGAFPGSMQITLPAPKPIRRGEDRRGKVGGCTYVSSKITKSSVRGDPIWPDKEAYAEPSDEEGNPSKAPKSTMESPEKAQKQDFIEQDMDPSFP